MEWFSRHTHWLYSETIELSNSSIYREKYQCIDKTLISTGDIKVQKSKIKYFPILIVYPEATPFIPPKVYILKNSISESIAQNYAKLSPIQIEECVRDNIYYFDRRHQNEDGSVCFLEAGDLHSDSAEYYSIKDIIKRVRRWLSGKIDIESAEVELFHHFRTRTRDLQYLITDLFFESEIRKGRYYAGLSTEIYANIISGAKRTYVGLMIYGENKEGVTLPPYVSTNKQLTLCTFLDDDLIEAILLEKKDKKNEAITSGRLIEGYWWNISKEPLPFSNIQKLAKYIGNDDEELGLDDLMKCLRDKITALEDIIHIGLRFHGRRDSLEWQMFRLKRGSRPVVIPTDETELKNRLLNYSVEAVYHENFTEKYFHMRNKGRADREVLRSKQVSIIGCGAIGSEIVDALSKAGIGKMLLIDKEELKAHNVIRHCAGFNRVAFPKAQAMMEYSILHNPFVVVEPKPFDILFKKIDQYLPENHIGISSIADDNIEAYLNEQAVIERKIMFYCRALRGGKTARIFRVIPEKDACKTCLSIYLKEKNPLFINIEEDEKLPVITNECNNPVRPASAADLKIIAGIFSRIFIDYSLRNDTKENHWIWTTDSLENASLIGEHRGSIIVKTIPPHRSCPTCQKLENKKVYILREVHEFIKKESASSKDIETGGILIGYRIAEKYIILRASGPGQKALRTKIRFEKDNDFCQKELEKALRELGQEGLYIGEWHYHTIESNSPSGLDIKSLSEIACQHSYHIDKPIMLIVSSHNEFAITIHDKNEQCVTVPIEVRDNLDGLETT